MPKIWWDFTCKIWKIGLVGSDPQLDALQGEIDSHLFPRTNTLYF